MNLRHNIYSSGRLASGAEFKLKTGRGVSFESVVVAIESGGLPDILAHPNQAKYPRQRVLVVACDSYAYFVPFVEKEDYFFLKTIIPSRKATKEYLNQGHPMPKIDDYELEILSLLREGAAQICCNEGRVGQVKGGGSRHRHQGSSRQHPPVLR